MGILKSIFLFFKKRPFVLVALLFGYIFFKSSEPKINVIKVDTNGTSLTDTQAQILAREVFEAMDGPFTNDSIIFNSLFPLDNASFNHVYVKFGIRESHDLIQWLIGDLSNSQFDRFRKKFDLVL